MRNFRWQEIIQGGISVAGWVFGDQLIFYKQMNRFHCWFMFRICNVSIFRAWKTKDEIYALD